MDQCIIELVVKGKNRVCLEIDHRPTETELAALLASDLFEKLTVVSKKMDQVLFSISGQTAVDISRTLIGWNPKE